MSMSSMATQVMMLFRSTHSKISSADTETQIDNKMSDGNVTSKRLRTIQRVMTGVVGRMIGSLASDWSHSHALKAFVDDLFTNGRKPISFNNGRWREVETANRKRAQPRLRSHSQLLVTTPDTGSLTTQILPCLVKMEAIRHQCPKRLFAPSLGMCKE